MKKMISMIIMGILLFGANEALAAEKDSVTRLETAKALSVVAENATKEQNLNFKDISKTDSTYLHNLVELNIVSNVEKFNPENEITRNQLAKMLYVLDGKPTINSKTNFIDVKKTHENYNAIQHSVEKGYLNVKNGNFALNQTVTKKELESIIATKKVAGTIFDQYEFDAMYYDLFINKFETKTYTIDSTHDMYAAYKDIFNTLPDKVVINAGKISGYKTEDLKNMYSEVSEAYNGESLPTMHGLAVYSTDKSNKNPKSFAMIDKSNTYYSAQAIAYAFDKFTDTVALDVKKDTVEETIYAVHDFMYDNFTYNAKGYLSMYVGNIYNQTIACNGFSYLSDTIFKKVGIDSSIRSGLSHYWNILKVDGKEITFDVTTDILLKKRYVTLGTSTKDHIELTSPIGFYSADFAAKEGQNVDAYTFTLKK